MKDVATLKDLYQQMAELTYSKCKEECRFEAVCCSNMYCDFAIKMCREREGINISPSNNPKAYLLDKENQCMAPPYCRPLCTLHICEKFFMDSLYYKKYFDLRQKIEELECDVYELEDF